MAPKNRREAALDSQDLEAQVEQLLADIDSMGDSHEFYLRVRQALDHLRAMGLPLPEDLVAIERQLEAMFVDGPPAAAVDD